MPNNPVANGWFVLNCRQQADALSESFHRLRQGLVVCCRRKEVNRLPDLSRGNFRIARDSSGKYESGRL
jgi:hypothetical protein